MLSCGTLGTRAPGDTCPNMALHLSSQPLFSPVAAHSLSSAPWPLTASFLPQHIVSRPRRM
eukprot:2317987-Prymnesium_polylepis.2